MFHEPEAWELWNKGIIEDYESTTGIYISANNLPEAIEWAENVGQELLCFVNNDNSLNWKELEYECWHEASIQDSGWSHCLGYFQHIKVGEIPKFQDMTAESYEQWINKKS